MTQFFKIAYVLAYILHTYVHTYKRMYALTYIKTSGSESRLRKVELASAHKKMRRLPRVFYT